MSFTAVAAQADIIDLDILISGSFANSALSGTVDGLATGTFDSDTGDISFTGLYDLNIPGIANLSFDAMGQVNGLTGIFSNTDCTLNSGLDLCNGVPLLGIPAFPVNTPLDLTFTSNSVDILGNGVIQSLFSAGDEYDPLAGDITFTLTGEAVPVPAAAWLFGSALIAMFGAKRRKV